MSYMPIRGDLDNFEDHTSGEESEVDEFWMVDGTVEREGVQWWSMNNQIESNSSRIEIKIYSQRLWTRAV